MKGTAERGAARNKQLAQAGIVILWYMASHYSSFRSPAAAAGTAAASGPAGPGAACLPRLALPALGPMNSFKAPIRICKQRAGLDGVSFTFNA